MKTAGYPGTPLVKKLGIKQGYVIKTVHQPRHYLKLLSHLPQITQKNRASKNIDLIHFFTKSLTELHTLLPKLKEQIKPNGIIWVSWPKKSSAVLTNITEDAIRETALANGLVDVKVCAIDATWSGLKLVIPVKDRKIKNYGKGNSNF